jgi:hypothetical protein
MEARMKAQIYTETRKDFSVVCMRSGSSWIPLNKLKDTAKTVDKNNSKNQTG